MSQHGSGRGYDKWGQPHGAVCEGSGLVTVSQFVYVFGV